MGTKVFIVGKQLVDYDDRKTGEHHNQRLQGLFLL